MKKTKKKLASKWIWCACLTLMGLIALLLMPGYDFTGLLFLGLAALIPTYHLLGLLKTAHPKAGKGLRTMLTVFLCVFFTAVLITGFVIGSSARGTQEPDSDYLVVLGAGVNGTVPSRSLRERLDAALAYLNTHPDAVAIVSGGQGNGEDITEALCMYRYLTEKGIDPDRIWMEDQATSTLENLRFSLSLIQDRTGASPDKLAIVSSEYHLHRANLFASQLGISAELVPAKTEIGPLRLNYYLREVFAVWYYSIFGGRNNA